MNANEIRHLAQRHEMMSNLCQRLALMKENLTYQHSRLEAHEIDTEKFFKDLRVTINSYNQNMQTVGQQVDQVRQSSIQLRKEIQEVTELVKCRSNPHYYMMVRLQALFMYILEVLRLRKSAHTTFQATLYKGPQQNGSIRA